LSGCASTSTHLPKQNVASVETPPQIQVRPASRTSAHLFAIEDPLTLAVEARFRGVANGGNRAVAINDLGMSHLLAGEKALALDKFKQAVELAPGSALYDNNRRLTLALKSDYLGATANLASGEAANILNDAGFIAKSRGDGAQAITLFEAAIKQSRVYHAKAHNNLKRAKELSEN